MNTLRGAVRPGRKTVSRLKPYRQSLRVIANPRQSIKRRKCLMTTQIGAGAWKELNRYYHCAISLLVMKRELIQRFLCLLDHLLLLAQLLKEFRKKLKGKCTPKQI